MPHQAMDLTIAQAIMKDRPVQDPVPGDDEGRLLDILRKRAKGEGVRGIEGVRNALKLQRSKEYRSIVDSLRDVGVRARTLNAGGPAETEFIRRLLQRRRDRAMHQAQDVGAARDITDLGVPEPKAEPTISRLMRQT